MVLGALKSKSINEISCQGTHEENLAKSYTKGNDQWVQILDLGKLTCQTTYCLVVANGNQR